MPEKQSNKERIQEITAGIEQGIKELFESDRYRNYLRTMSRFHKYSLNNVMLIHAQRPDATLVAGFNRWKNSFGRHVKRGERGIQILAPTPYKIKVDREKLDPETKLPLLDDGGNPITEEKEVTIPMFKVVSVFDVSQTEGKPLPQLSFSLTGDVAQYEVFMEALRRSAPVPITFEAMAANMDGYFSANHQKIAIRQGMSEVQTVSATVHEIAHSKLHNQKKIQIANDEQYQEIELFDKPGLFSNGRIARDNLPEGVYCYDLRGSDYDPGEPVCVEERVVVNHAGSVLLTEPLDLTENGRLMLTEEEGLNFTGTSSTLSHFLQEQRKDRRTEEIEAESISYAVCQYFGIETASNSFGYIASWSQGKELKELRASLETINKTSSELITSIEKHFQEICKEQSIDLTAQEPTLPDVSALSESRSQKHVYRLVSNFHRMGPEENTSVKKYIYDKNHKLIPAEIVYIGTYADCLEVQNKLRDGIVTESQVKAMNDSEKMYIIEGKTYLHIQRTDEGFDYSLYDKETSKLLDGGQTGTPEQHIDSVCLNICDQHGLNGYKVSYAPKELAESLQNAQQSTAVLESEPVPAKDVPLPDATITPQMMEHFGYTDSDMLPLSKDRAMELMDKDITVYMLYSDNTEEMVFDAEDVVNHDGLFGISREEWEAVWANIPPRDVEQRFLNSPTDSMAIYQLRRDAPAELRFVGLEKMAAPPDPANYEAVYTCEVCPDKDTSRILENFFYIFNEDRPTDFTGHSLSVSDIVALKLDGEVSYHYCDSVGFKELPSFQRPENYLKAAEMSMEDDYGMIDGIINNGMQPTAADLEQQSKSGQSISLMDLADTIYRERKSSVLEKLKDQPQQPQLKAKPRKSKEKEI